MSNQVVLRPLRFSTDVQAMRGFLELLGLRSRVESERGGWVDMVAGRGMAALHDAASSNTAGRPGETRLSFETDDIDELAQRLRDAGYADATTSTATSCTMPGPTSAGPSRRSSTSRTSRPGSDSWRRSAVTPLTSSRSGHPRRRGWSYGSTSAPPNA
jgi:hypothetical protein